MGDTIAVNGPASDHCCCEYRTSIVRKSDGDSQRAFQARWKSVSWSAEGDSGSHICDLKHGMCTDVLPPRFCFSKERSKQGLEYMYFGAKLVPINFRTYVWHVHPGAVQVFLDTQLKHWPLHHYVRFSCLSHLNDSKYFSCQPWTWDDSKSYRAIGWL